MKKKAQENNKDICVQVFVGGIIVNKEGKLFFAKGKKFEEKYIFPGGKVQEGETLEESAVREIKEETGLDVNVVDQLRFGEFINRKEEAYAGKRFMLGDFLLQYDGGDDEVSLNEEYVEGSGGWFTLEEALDLDFGGDVCDVVEVYKKYLERHDALNGWRRCLADFENLKKRQETHGRELAERSTERTIGEFLPVLDNLSSSLAHVPETHKDDSWVMGLTYIHKQFEDALRDSGIEEIAVQVGDEFDPNFHEAVESTDKGQVTREQENQEQPKATSPQMRGSGESPSRGGVESVTESDNESSKVEKVIQKGYRFKERVIRPARVIAT